MLYHIEEDNNMVKIFNFDDSYEVSANIYVVGKIGGNCAVIDFGSSDESVFDYIDSHYDRCIGLFLTHGHFDHLRGVNEFCKRHKDVPVYIHSEDVPLLDNPALNCSQQHGEKVKVMVPVTEVKDGDVIETKDFKIKVIHTPFHTAGSVCYLFEDDNALFSGDTLFKGSIGREDMPTSVPEFRESSLDKLKSLRNTLVVYPGHGPVTKLQDELTNNPYLK